MSPDPSAPVTGLSTSRSGSACARKVVTPALLAVGLLALTACGGTATSTVTVTATATVEATVTASAAPETAATSSAPSATASATPEPAASSSASAEEEAAAPTPSPTATKPRFNASDYDTLSRRTFKKLVKAPDRYIGKKVVLYGNVNQFDAATGACNFLADTAERNVTSYGFFNGENSWIEARSRCSIFDDVVEGDIFKMYAEVGPSFSYDTQIGGNTTVPTFIVDRIKVIGSTD